MNYSLWAFLHTPLSSFNRANLVLALIFRTVFVGAAVGFLFAAINGLYFGDIGHWREVQATVTGNSAHDGEPTVYTPKLSYLVDGKTYTGEGTQATESQYTVGSQITIDVNPDDPVDIWQRGSAGYPKIVLLGMVLVITVPFVLIGVRTIMQLVELRRAS